MSKLSRRIRNVGRPAAGPMGFTHGPAQARARQVLVAAEASDGAAARAALEAGVDALVVPPSLAREAVEAAGGRPVGVRLGAATADAVGAAIEAGADFFLFDDAATPATALLRSRGADDRGGLGRVLVLGDDRSEERLRTLGALNLDAVLVDGFSEGLSVREQLALRRVADLSGGTLLAAAANGPAPSAAALEAWRDAGASIVLLPADERTLAAVLAAAAEVPAPRRQRDDRAPMVPFVSAAEHDDDDHDLL
jgi:beta-glucosidase-like glycosyl hydrolase